MTKIYELLVHNLSSATTGYSVVADDRSAKAKFADEELSLYILIPITIIFGTIFFTGVIGNIVTCIVIASNKSIRTVTNCYLFSLAISDLLLLISSVPVHLYVIWSGHPDYFNKIFCFILMIAIETTIIASILTITAFTVERYIAICHPLKLQAISTRSRAVKLIITIWLISVILPISVTILFKMDFCIYYNVEEPEDVMCRVELTTVGYCAEVCMMLFFVVPMTILTVLYVLIGLSLKRSGDMSLNIRYRRDSTGENDAAQRNVIRMLMIVVAAFFICWAPFHAEQLIGYRLSKLSPDKGEVDPRTLHTAQSILHYVSRSFYYLSATINPLVYNIMSSKFRKAFATIRPNCCTVGRPRFGNRDAEIAAVA